MRALTDHLESYLQTYLWLTFTLVVGWLIKSRFYLIDKIRRLEEARVAYEEQMRLLESGGIEGNETAEGSAEPPRRRRGRRRPKSKVKPKGNYSTRFERIG